jgi:hypothetical protein
MRDEADVFGNMDVSLRLGLPTARSASCIIRATMASRQCRGPHMAFSGTGVFTSYSLVGLTYLHGTTTGIVSVTMGGRK